MKISSQQINTWFIFHYHPQGWASFTNVFLLDFKVFFVPKFTESVLTQIKRWFNSSLQSLLLPELKWTNWQNTCRVLDCETLLHYYFHYYYYYLINVVNIKTIKRWISFTNLETAPLIMTPPQRGLVTWSFDMMTVSAWWSNQRRLWEKVRDDQRTPEETVSDEDHVNLQLHLLQHWLTTAGTLILR